MFHYGYKIICDKIIVATGFNWEVVKKDNLCDRFVTYSIKKSRINLLKIGAGEGKRAERTQWVKKRRRFSVRKGEFERREKATKFEQRFPSQAIKKQDKPAKDWSG